MGDRFHYVGRISEFGGDRVEVGRPLENSGHSATRVGASDCFIDFSECDIERLAPNLVDRREHRRRLGRLHTHFGKDRGEKPSVGYLGSHVVRAEADPAHHVDGEGQQLRVRHHGCLANDVGVELEVLAQPSLLLPLVAE